MKKIFVFFAILPSLIWGQEIVSNTNFSALDPSFTTLPSGEPVLFWVEKDGNQKCKFNYRIYRNNRFEETVTVPTPDSIATHAEGMPRLAVKANGEMLVTYELAKSDKTSRFGSDLYYQTSKDGKEWSKPQFINPERDPTKSSSFSKPIRLSDGEIGMAWLDENITGKGRSLKFTKSKPDGGLEPIRVIDEQTCQCCRVELLSDQQAGVYVFYRNMSDDNIRDIYYVHSKNYGKEWEVPKVVFADNWQFEGCPHAGPSATIWKGKPHVAWYCGSDEKSGVKLSDLETKELSFDFVSTGIRSPQITANDSFMAIVYTEYFESNNFMNHIVVESLDTKGKKTKEIISMPFEDSNLPSLITYHEKLLVAYELKRNGKGLIIVKVINKTME